VNPAGDKARRSGQFRAAPGTGPARPAGGGDPRSRGALYAGVVIGAGGALGAYAVWTLVRQPVGAEWLFLLALTVACGWATLRIPGMPISFSISDIFSIASALVFGPAAGALTASLDGLVLSLRMATSERSLQRVAFNASAPAIAIWAAAEVYLRLAGPEPRIDGPLAALWLLVSVTVFCLVDYGLNTGIVSMAVALERRLPVRHVWRQHFAGLWLSYFGGGFGAMLLMLLARLHTLDAVILLTPLPVILYTAFRHAVGRVQDQISHLGKVNRVYVASIEALTQAVDAKDHVTHDHVRRVQTRSVELARVLGVDDELELQAIRAASLLHDVGKLAIPEHILSKPGRLTPAEYEVMKRHAAIGADILSVIDFPYPLEPIVRHHHENWDGTGYPDGLAGDEIPIGARILAVVDCFDALTSDRPYRPRLPDRDALRILAERSGTMYDPKVVEAFFAFHQIEPHERALPVIAEGVSNMPVAEAAAAPEAARAPELATFFALGRALADLSPRTNLAAVLHAHLQPHLPPVTVVVHAYDAGLDAIVAVSEAGAPASGVRAGSAILLGDRLSGWVAATGQSVINCDPRLDLDEAARETSPFRSALAVQVLSGERGRLLGVVSLFSTAGAAFDDANRRLMIAVGSALGASLHTLAPLQPVSVADRNSPGLGTRHAR
jgi:putative nucleotidyltransferase with HDIG domain